ncbi:hypothetical protein F2Q68_00015989 [Brassica cretica]|uniref:Uncharacterized protein n=1 Tax=Brassica cretica TaxID=69181 RepID=A0A8S9HBJ9_BRACR|nr:hypothetical protein F2Q68_00015989 [Brassica cretica]
MQGGVEESKTLDEGSVRLKAIAAGSRHHRKRRRPWERKSSRRLRANKLLLTDNKEAQWLQGSYLLGRCEARSSKARRFQLKLRVEESKESLPGKGTSKFPVKFSLCSNGLKEQVSHRKRRIHNLHFKTNEESKTLEEGSVRLRSLLFRIAIGNHHKSSSSMEEEKAREDVFSDIEECSCLASLGDFDAVAGFRFTVPLSSIL